MSKEPKCGRGAGLIRRWRERLPLDPAAEPISLGEGDTPLIRLRNIPRELPGDFEIHVKFEGLNPTGSFKDRGMTVAVTQAVFEGARGVICASTGNTSASAAAYAVRAGMTPFVLIPDGKIAAGKLAQALMHGAVIVQIRGNFDDGMRIVREMAGSAKLAIVNSINPYRLQGQKTAAFEIHEALGDVPDFHALPVGNAGNISAHWIGYSELAGQPTAACAFCGGSCPHPGGVVTRRPRMLGYQARGAAPFLRGAPVDAPETVATAIRIGHPQSWDAAWAAVRESDGWFDELSDEEILAAQALLAEREGIFCEPASAASVAGVLRDIRAGRLGSGGTVVCTLTGHGLKDPDIALRRGLDGVETVEADRRAVERVLARHL